jgi:hypothetical protein
MVLAVNARMPWSEDELENASDEDLLSTLVDAAAAGNCQDLRLQLDQEMRRRLALMRSENEQMAQHLASKIYDSIPASAAVAAPAPAKSSMELFDEMFSRSPSAAKGPDLFADMFKEVKAAAKPPAPKATVFVSDYDDRNVQFYAECVKATELAILVKVGDEKYWFPKSVVHEDSEVYDEGHKGSLIVPTKMAEQKGIG